MKNSMVALLATMSLCNGFPSCYMRLDSAGKTKALLTIESSIKSPKRQKIVYVCSCPVCQKNAQSQNQIMDYETQLVLTNFGNIVGNFINIVQDPNNKEHVGKHLSSLIGSVINIAQQVVKRSPVPDHEFTYEFAHFTDDEISNKCCSSIDPIIELINSLILLAIEFITDNPELSLLETQYKLQEYADDYLKKKH